MATRSGALYSMGKYNEALKDAEAALAIDHSQPFALRYTTSLRVRCCWLCASVTCCFSSHRMKAAIVSELSKKSASLKNLAESNAPSASKQKEEL